MTSDDGLGRLMTQKEASFDRLTKPCTMSLPTLPPARQSDCTWETFFFLVLNMSSSKAQFLYLGNLSVCLNSVIKNTSLQR